MKILSNKYKLIVILVSILIVSCNENESISNDELINQETSIKLEPTYSLLNFEPNIYHDYFRKTNNSIGFSSLKSDALTDYSTVKAIKLNNLNSSVKISINDEELNTSLKSKKVNSLDSENIYGQKISFDIVSNKATKDGNNDRIEKTVEMYAPDLIEITNPKIRSAEQLFPICYFKDFVLEWNADVNNKEGLVVAVEYFGENAIPSSSKKKRVLNVDFIEIDNGRTVLDKSLFKSIPNLSIVHIVLLRGNVAIEEVDGENYKFFAESHVRMPIILVKDLSTITK